MKRNLLLIIFLTSSLSSVFGQETIRGIIKDDTGSPLPGSTVLIEGTNSATLADAKGEFSIAAAKELPFTIIVNSVGYKSQDIEIYELTGEALDVSLKSSNILDEVVVVGYGQQERKNLVGSIAKIDASQTNHFPVASVDAQLQGKAAGVQINSNTGIPGEAVSVRIRGTTSITASNSPLYVLDGVFINTNSLQTANTGGPSTNPLADINPSDIESIEVLKDANATAIYGSRGANGVVIITTKRGNYGSKTKFNLNVMQGVAKVQESRLWNLVPGPESAAFVNESWINSGIDNPALNQTFANRPYRPVAEGGRGLPEEQGTYDRLDAVFRTAKLSEYDLSVQGGTKNTKYYIGGNYTFQEATVRPSYFERASLKFNLDQKLTDKVTLGISNSISRSFRNQIIYGSTPRGIFQSALLTATNLPTTNEDGTPALWGGFDNVDVLVNNNFMSTVSLRYIGNLYADFDLTPELKFRTSWSIDYNNYDENEYWTNQTVVGAPPTNGKARSSVSQNSNWVNEQTLSYRKTFGAHTIGALVGNTLQSNRLNNLAAEGTNFPNNSYQQISSASVFKAFESTTKANLASFFSRAEYNFSRRYFIEASLRADGSSRFGTNNRWGYFPSVGAAWRIKDESFLKDNEVISNLKIRTSVGLTGNQAGISDFASQGLWSGGQGYFDSSGGELKPGTAPQQIENPNLKWEKTRQINLGVDVGLVKGRVGLEFNLYHKLTKDALLALPLPGTSGFTSYTSNAGVISNKGIEFEVNTVNIEGKNFTWQTSFNIARNINKIEELPNPINAGLVTLQQGYPMFSYLVYNQLSVDPQTGNAVYEDVDGNGAITANDRVISGMFTPRYFGGITNSLTYKSFDFSIFFSFQEGNKLYNTNREYGENGGTRADRSYHESQRDRWLQPGDITDVPRITTVGTNYNRSPNSRFLEDASFLRLKSLSIGYSVPASIVQKIKLVSTRVYVNASNLWLLTKYSGPDPEVYVSSSNQNSVGSDFCVPPQPRSIQAGINIVF